MKSVLVTVLVAGGLLSVAVWFARRGEVPVRPLAPASTAVDPDALPIAKEPPYPRAVIDRTDLDFGVMEVSQESKHIFRVTNKGEAPLLLKKGATTCQCTLSKVAEKPIPPGETAEIELTWKPEMATEQFDKGATIYTNDPNMRSFQLSIRGHVMQRLNISPSGGMWTIEEVSDTEPSSFVGNVYSNTVKSFKITNVDTGSPNVTADVQPMGPTTLNQLHAASGYTIQLTVQPNKSAGSFSYPVKIHTDLKDRLPSGKLGENDMALNVTLHGSRKGAVKFFGVGFDPLDTAYVLGSFLAKEGRTKDLRMMLTRLPESGVKVLSVKTEPEVLKVEVVPEGEARPRKNSQVFKVQMSYPPGGPLLNHSDPGNPAMVTITTDHPEVPEIKLKVYFGAF